MVQGQRLRTTLGQRRVPFVQERRDVVVHQRRSKRRWRARRDRAHAHAAIGNRLQTLEETRAIVEAARTLQFRSGNIDLIYGVSTAVGLGAAQGVRQAGKSDQIATMGFGGTGDDTMTGGSGIDIFDVGAESAGLGEVDTITDFGVAPGEEDILDISDLMDTSLFSRTTV